MWNNRRSVLSPSDKPCSYAISQQERHTNIKMNHQSRIPGGETGKPKRTRVDGLLLRLHPNLALACDLPRERYRLSHDSGAVSLAVSPSDDAAGHAPRSGLLRAPHAAREHKLHRAGLAHRTREPLRAATTGVEIRRSALSEFEVEEGVTKVVDLEGETPNRGRVDKEGF
jgi:hypothetical protein